MEPSRIDTQWPGPAVEGHVLVRAQRHPVKCYVFWLKLRRCVNLNAVVVNVIAVEVFMCLLLEAICETTVTFCVELYIYIDYAECVWRVLNYFCLFLCAPHTVPPVWPAYFVQQSWLGN
jgi:hypothetical protein